MTNLPYLNLTRSELLADLKSRVSAHRYKHILGVEATCLALADRYHLNRDKARIAGLLHDYAKSMSYEDLYCYRHNPAYDPAWEEENNAIWHGPLAVMIAQDRFGLTDLEIMSAIWHHTLGAISWTDTGKILFIADFIEPNRIFPEVIEARRLAEESLDLAITYKFKANLIWMIQKEQNIHPQSIAAYNAWFNRERKDYEQK